MEQKRTSSYLILISGEIDEDGKHVEQRSKCECPYFDRGPKSTNQVMEIADQAKEALLRLWPLEKKY